MRPMALGALPAIVRGGNCLFLDYFETMQAFMAFCAQLAGVLNWQIGLAGLVPEGNLDGVRIADRLMTNITTDILPYGLVYQLAPTQFRTWFPWNALASVAVESNILGLILRIPIFR